MRHTDTTTSTAAAARKATRGVSFFHLSTFLTRRVASCSPKARAMGMGRSAAFSTRERLYSRLAWSPSVASTASSQLISRSRQKNIQQSHTAGFHQYTARMHHASSFHQGSPRRMWWRSWTRTQVRSIPVRPGRI